MFEIQEFTEAHLASVTNRVEKHGDDERPAVSLGIEIEAPNTLLDSIEPALRHALFKPKPDDTPELPGVDPSTPVLRCNSIDRVSLATVHEGWRLAIDNNVDPQDPMRFGSVKVDKLSVEPRQGGTVTLRLRLGTSDVDAERLGALAMMNGGPLWLTLLKPEKAPDGKVIDGTVEAFRRDHPDATDLFAGGGPDREEEDQSDSEGAKTDAEARVEAMSAAGASNEVGKPEATKPSRRRGRKATSEAVE